VEGEVGETVKRGGKNGRGSLRVQIRNRSLDGFTDNEGIGKGGEPEKKRLLGQFQTHSAFVQGSSGGEGQGKLPRPCTFQFREHIVGLRIRGKK